MLPLRNDIHERFAIAYVALEIAEPDGRGHGKRAYQATQPDAAEHTAENQASTLLARPEVKDRIDWMLLDSRGAGHVVRAGAFIDDLLLKAATLAEAQGDAATLLRLGELLDRGRASGAKYVKETRSTKKIENPFAGLSADEVRAKKREAFRELAKQDPELVREALGGAQPDADRKSGEPHGGSDPNRGSQSVH